MSGVIDKVLGSCIPLVAAKGFFRFQWRNREPYGCPGPVAGAVRCARWGLEPVPRCKSLLSEPPAS